MEKLSRRRTPYFMKRVVEDVGKTDYKQLKVVAMDRQFEVK